MNMGTVECAFKHSGKKNIVIAQGFMADRAASFNVPFKAVHTAAYMHKAVLPAGNGWEG